MMNISGYTLIDPICEAGDLAELHSNGLVHKDIKPEHVLLNSAGHVWLTGLGVASRLTRERQAPAPPEVIAGTLAYMAPEQTGRMNRSVDSRSDLYALGITFYQMLSGVLPFNASDPMEWFHCHIARQPVPLTHQVSGLPEPLSDIVMKLMAKTGEARYQSVSGLDADLRRCLEEWESNARITRFPLGANDLSDRLLIPEKLYGRESEIETLLAAFDRVLATGMPEIALVSGYSGIDKTSVVNELHKVLVSPRALFAAGKFDQYKRDIPYATLIQSFQALVRHILGKSETEIGVWQEPIRNAVTPNGQLIVDLIPEVELIIGEQPTVPELPPQEARNRFQMVLLKFLGCFAGPEHPLVLFLDDLQWLDKATLDLIEHLGTEQDVRHLLLIGAYRDNEVSPTHPLMRVLEAIRKAGTGLQEIVLAPLAIDDVCGLIADSLHCERSRTLPLAQLVHEKTGGNPFFALQFLTALAEEGLLTFDPSAPAWRWDMENIRARNYTDNVVDLMAEKLQRLQATTQEALKQLGVLYLENNLITGAFTPERRFALEVLAAQAAISLEISGVYEALQESEERLRSVLNAADIVAWEANPEKGRLFEAGPVGELFGRGKDFSHSQVVDFAKSIHPNDRDRVMDSINRSLHGEGGYNEEFRVPMADGSVRWIAANGNLQTYTEGKPGRLLGIARDITNQKLAEKEIAWNLAINQALSSLYIPLVRAGTSIEQIADVVLEKSRQLTSSAHGYVAEIDPENGDLIAHTNTKMMRTECAIVEEELRKIRFPRGADGLYNGLWGHSLNTKEPFYTDEPVKHPSSVGTPEGHITIERFMTVPVLLAEELVGQIALSNSTRAYTDQDVNAINRIAEFYALAIQHKRAEEELRAHRDHLEELVKQRSVELTIARDTAEEARRSAEDANQAKSTFLANISHELRTPLNAILGYSHLMQRDASLLPKQQEYLNTINRSGEHLLALINDVLEISKIEAGQITLDVATFDLWTLLDDLEDMFRVRTDAKGLRLDFIGINDVTRYLESDENKLRQILINVLGNAVKFTKRGSVTLRVSVKSMDQEPVCKDTKYLCFEVEDTGVGIAEEELDKVFGAFEQTESGRMNKTGTGLGMAITQNYVRMMGGDIIVVSTPGKGSIFRFEIAVSEGSQVDIKEQTMQQKRVIALEPGQDVPRILVAEDLEESRITIHRDIQLEKPAYGCTCLGCPLVAA
jgi:PAS domain S-box-containing protein